MPEEKEKNTFSKEFEERLSWDEKSLSQLVILNPEDRPKEQKEDENGDAAEGSAE